MKHVERAIYEAKLPNLVPQRHDERTIKIPVPKYVFPRFSPPLNSF